MRIQGRLLRASTLAERRVLKSIGVDFIRCRRSLNPFSIARSIRRIANGLPGSDLPKLRRLLAPRPPQPELPDSRSSAPDASAAT